MLSRAEVPLLSARSRHGRRGGRAGGIGLAHQWSRRAIAIALTGAFGLIGGPLRIVDDDRVVLITNQNPAGTESDLLTAGEMILNIPLCDDNCLVAAGAHEHLVWTWTLSIASCEILRQILLIDNDCPVRVVCVVRVEVGVSMANDVIARARAVLISVRKMRGCSFLTHPNRVAVVAKDDLFGRTHGCSGVSLHACRARVKVSLVRCRPLARLLRSPGSPLQLEEPDGQQKYHCTNAGQKTTTSKITH